MTCAACHQADGAGLGAQFPPLASSEYVTGDSQRLIHIVLRGLTGEIEVEGEMFKGEMPGWAPALNDAQVAAVLTYIRKSFGNNAPPVTAQQVEQVRTASALRSKPYTSAELPKLKAPAR
ncbi:MAG: cytochrome c [Phycisphaerae bacterium]|nr:cytochrome c [Gemmatimonadaceae bacterium]